MKYLILKKIDIIDFYINNINDFTECVEDDSFIIFLYNEKKKLLKRLSALN